jgi:hypothetical protein
MTCTTDFDRCKSQALTLVREGAPYPQNRTRLSVTQIWSWAPDGA